MKKGILTLVLCMLMLTGCGQKQTLALGPTGHFSVTKADTMISLGAPAGPVLDALGAPFGYAESKSSSFMGVEKTYRFSGLNLHTYPSEDGDRILGLLITDCSLPTAEGIAVGDHADQVRECYGENAIQNGCCVISHSREQMILTLKDNVVTAIQYTIV